MLLFAFPATFFALMQAPFSTSQGIAMPIDISEDRALLYFGFTACPEICPTTMTQLSTAKDKVPHSDLGVYFINVTRENTENEAQLYAEAFNESFKGVQMPDGGFPELTKQLNIKYESDITQPDMEHTTSLFVLERNNSGSRYDWTLKTVYTSSPPNLNQLVSIFKNENIWL